MTCDADVLLDLQAAANRIFEVDPADRQRLIVRGIHNVASLERRIRHAGHPSGATPAFLADMPKLAEVSAEADAVEAVVAAGMMMLAEEIERLRGIADGLTPSESQPTMAEVLKESGFEPFTRGRIIVEERRNSERLRRPIDKAD